MHRKLPVACMIATLASSAAFAVSPGQSARTPRCNVDPYVNQMLAVPAGKTVQEFETTFRDDAAFRARMGEIAYLGHSNFQHFENWVVLAFPPLDDPFVVQNRLFATGEFKSLTPNGNLCFSAGPPPVRAAAVEYHNAILDHYFMTADAGEQTSIEAGNVGPGWSRTGKSFVVEVQPSCPVATEDGYHPVYRFAGEPGVGPSSHFFTAGERECAVLRDRKEWRWQFEGAPFWASEPVAGACPAGAQTVYRAYNASKGGTPNHRYAVDRGVIASMVAKGWVDEGAAMCVVGE